LRLSHERLHRLETENRILRELRRLDLLEKYGPAGKQLSDEQLELLEREPGVSSAEVEAESERAQLKLSFKQPRKHPGRQELPAYLPCIEKIVACTPEQCVCGNCVKENRVIGFEKSEQLHGPALASQAACTWAGVGLGRIKPIEIRSAHIL
jgi:Transposase C of IS166 homeodomain